VARWDLPTPSQLLGSQQLGRRDGAHNILHESLPRLVARNPQRVQTEAHAGGLITPTRLAETGRLGFWMRHHPAQGFRISTGLKDYKRSQIATRERNACSRAARVRGAVPSGGALVESTPEA
jgi:hypothetical protein